MTQKPLSYLSKTAGAHDWGEAVELADIGGEIAIVGVGETAFTGASNRDNKAMALEAIETALEDAGILPGEVDGLMVSFGIAKQLKPQDYRDHFGTTQDIWFSDQGGAMIWAATCAHDAAMAIKAREASVIVNVFAVDWATARQNGSASPGDWHASEPLKSALRSLTVGILSLFILQPSCADICTSSVPQKSSWLRFRSPLDSMRVLIQVLRYEKRRYPWRPISSSR